jgi:predicted transglutaminase-like cysteine proteinase
MDVLQASFVQRWGAASVPKFDSWRKLVVALGDSSDLDRVKRVNAFVNQQTQFADDIAIWNQLDYWATPLETLGRSAGDCEDFAIAKYFTLLQVGVQQDKLRLIYVRAKTGTSDSTQAHMVLAYYATPDAEPLVMDNLIGDVRPASRRPDLVPVFSFNSAGVFVGIAGSGPVAAGTGRLSRWEDLLRRARAEGFD